MQKGDRHLIYIEASAFQQECTIPVMEWPPKNLGMDHTEHL